MPELTIVLPVYGVEDYLPECLDSILSETAVDFDVVAIDDASPDRCPEILDGYAAADPRLRVIHLDHNVGLGGARNAALAHATGDYIWFVDSDDRLPTGALLNISKSLGRLRPDVLLVDFANLYPGGEMVANPWHRLLAGAPETFALRERPEILGLIMTAWNKIVRREFLAGLGVEFGPGLYEDLSVTYPILLAAGTIGRLDRVCYHYRRGRGGAITATASERHFEVFDQYERVFAFLGPDHELAGPVFDRVVRQSATLLATPGLVPPAARRRFFHRMSANFTRFRPPGHRFPGGIRGIQYRMIARDSYVPYAVLQALSKAKLAVPAPRRVTKALRIAYYQTQRLRAVDPHLAIYAIYWYRGYGCNAAAIYEKARELAPEVRGVWVVRADRVATLPPGVDYVVADSARYLRLMARAKYLVNNVNFPHETAKRPGSVHLQTQHGTPLKTLGMDLKDHPAAADGMNFERLAEHVARWDFLVSPNPHSTEVFRRCYPGTYRVLETGYPRNDRLVNATPADVASVRESLGLADGVTAVLYAPTFRSDPVSLSDMLDLGRLAAALGPSHVVLARAHHFTPGSAGLPDGVLDVSWHPRVEDLCVAADVLVTDYSSIMFDYACLDRPIVVYAPDWEEYRRVRGVYFDLLKEPPGPVARTQEELPDAILSAGPPDPAFRARFCALEDGHAAERVVRAVFLQEGTRPTA